MLQTNDECTAQHARNDRDTLRTRQYGWWDLVVLHCHRLREDVRRIDDDCFRWVLRRNEILGLRGECGQADGDRSDHGSKGLKAFHKCLASVCEFLRIRLRVYCCRGFRNLSSALFSSLPTACPAPFWMSWPVRLAMAF